MLSARTDRDKPRAHRRNYYFLVIRCSLRGEGLAWSGLLHRVRCDDPRCHMVEHVSVVFFTDHEATELLGGPDPDVVVIDDCVLLLAHDNHDDGYDNCSGV
ncbi:RING-H2 finger protein ATL1-like [Hordeum vulgare]|nr:RING-H2 finger protein ATL1-like [Hordeum vulgare]